MLPGFDDLPTTPVERKKTRKVGDMVLPDGVELRERPQFDYYPTRQRALVRAALLRIKLDYFPLASPRTILEPAAGNGAWVNIAREVFPLAPICAVEVDHTVVPRWAEQVSQLGISWLIEDYLLWQNHVTFDLIVGNPPYGKNAKGEPDKLMAEKFVRKAYRELKPGGVLAFLLLLNFLGSKGRESLYADCCLDQVLVVSPRPSFFDSVDKTTGKVRKNSTDAREYALFVFRKPRLDEPPFDPAFYKGGWLRWEREE